VNDFEAAIAAARVFESRFDLGLVPDEVAFGNGGIGAQGEPDPIDNDTAPVVAPHDIHYDTHKSKESRKKPPVALLRDYDFTATVTT
jgi:hypothetical protein